MNIEQIKSGIVAFLAAAVPIITFLVTYGVPRDIAAIVTVVLGVVAVIAYAIISRGDKGLLLSVKSVKGAEVTIDPSVASKASIAVANDPAVSHVEPTR